MKMRKALEDAGIKKKKYRIAENISHYNSMNSGRSELLDEINTLSISMSEDKLWERFAKTRGCKPNKEDCFGASCKNYFECKIMIEDIANTDGIIKIGRAE